MHLTVLGKDTVVVDHLNDADCTSEKRKIGYKRYIQTRKKAEPNWFGGKQVLDSPVAKLFFA